MQKHTFQSEVCAADSPGDARLLTATDLRTDRLQQPRGHVRMRAFLRRSWKMFVIVETVPQTGEKRSFRSFGRFGLRHVRGPETLLEPVLQRQTVFLKQGLQKRNRCQLHRVYNRPDGKQASFYFYLIQHRDNEPGAVPQILNKLKFFKKTTESLQWQRVPLPPTMFHPSLSRCCSTFRSCDLKVNSLNGLTMFAASGCSHSNYLCIFPPLSGVLIHTID